jgi:hypothetical protein
VALYNDNLICRRADCASRTGLWRRCHASGPCQNHRGLTCIAFPSDLYLATSPQPRCPSLGLLFWPGPRAAHQPAGRRTGTDQPLAPIENGRFRLDLISPAATQSHEGTPEARGIAAAEEAPGIFERNSGLGLGRDGRSVRVSGDCAGLLEVGSASENEQCAFIWCTSIICLTT